MSKGRRLALAVALVAALAAPMGQAAAQALPGALDPTFGGDGKVTTDLGAGEDVAAQPDGTLVVVGSAQGTSLDFAVTRYNADGSPDPTFGSHGRVTTDFWGGDDGATSVAIRSDGEIVVAGTASGGSIDDFGVALYEANGTPDTSFGYYGKQNVDVIDGDDVVGGMALYPDGRIVVVGAGRTWWPTKGPSVFKAVRFQRNGVLDPTFGTSGRVTTDVGPGDDFGHAVTLLGDGRIVAAGTATVVDTATMDTSSNFALVRYNPDGSRDPTFGTNGVVTTDVIPGSPSTHDVADASSLVALPDGRLVVVGSVWVTGFDFGAVRYNTNGSLDTAGSSPSAMPLAARPPPQPLVGTASTDRVVTDHGNPDSRPPASFDVASRRPRTDLQVELDGVGWPRR